MTLDIFGVTLVGFRVNLCGVGDSLFGVGGSLGKVDIQTRFTQKWEDIS